MIFQLRSQLLAAGDFVSDFDEDDPNGNYGNDDDDDGDDGNDNDDADNNVI